jgi:hypothetical protein
METTENSGKEPLTWSTSSPPFTTDLFISWSQTGRVSFRCLGYGVCSKVFKARLKPPNA